MRKEVFSGLDNGKERNLVKVRCFHISKEKPTDKMLFCVPCGKTASVDDKLLILDLLAGCSLLWSCVGLIMQVDFRFVNDGCNYWP